MSTSIAENQVRNDKESQIMHELPHVEVNQIQLSVIIRNLCVYSVTELKQFFKLSIPNQRHEMLKLIIYLRNQFLRLYVLIKWVKTIKNNNFHILIDLLNYLRIKNMNVGQCIWNLKNIVINSTINAKLPKPDLETALEVFTLGTPQLIDNHSFFDKLRKLRANTTQKTNYISDSLILKRLEDLDVTLSVKIAMSDVPKKFLDGTKSIRDGKWFIEIPGEYELILSTTGDDAPFHLVELTFLLSSSSVDMSTYQTNKNLQHQINSKLSSNTDKVLHHLDEILTKKILFLRIFLCKQIIDTYNKTRGNFETPLQVLYDESSLTVHYWINSKIVSQSKDCSIYIDIKKDEFGDNNLKLNLRWNISIPDQTKQLLGIKLEYSENVFENLVQYITNIIDDHMKLLKYNLYRIGGSFFNRLDEYDRNLVFEIPISSKDKGLINLDIEKRSGRFYMVDKSNSINSLSLLKKHSDALNKAHLTTRDTISLLQNMKVNYAINILQNMFIKTGWSVYDESQIYVGSLDDNTKIKKMFIRMRNWPLNWYLVVSNEIISDSEIFIQIRIIKLIKESNKWKVKHLSECLKIDENTNVTSISLNQVTYRKVSQLQSTILSKIINHGILDIFAELKLQVMEFSTEKHNLKFLPEHIQTKISSEKSLSSFSLFGIKSANYMTAKEYSHLVKPLLFLLINSDNDITLYGSFSDSFDTSYLQKCDKDELEVTFVDKKAFYLKYGDISKLHKSETCEKTNDEMKSSLNKMKQILLSYKSKLQHLMVLTSTITKLVESFPEENFQIVRMSGEEICFNYLPKFSNNEDSSDYDCKIKVDNHSLSKGLNFELSEKNPQKELNSIIDTIKSGTLNHTSMFKYYHMTSQLFATLEHLKNLQKGYTENESIWNFKFYIHGASEFKLDYYLKNEKGADCISLLIKILPIANSSKYTTLQYKLCAYLPDLKHHKNKTTSTTSSKTSAIFSSIQKTCFQLISSDPILDDNYMNGATSVVKLNDSLCCSAEDLYKVLMYIHKLIVP
ncbi:hypothetical protein QEN19_000395 [Hanseniaspora menglaensis]